MKLIIIEGLDNTGKSLMTSKLIDYLESLGTDPDRILMIHSTAPKGKTLEEQKRNINNYNIDLANQCMEWQEDNKYDFVVLDRAWYSEYVYGQIYRDRTAEDLLKVIHICENYITLAFPEHDVTCLYFTVNCPEFLINHEDGLSLSENDIEKIKREIVLFHELYEATGLRKFELVVNEDADTFRNAGEIFNNIKNYIFH